MVTEGRMYATIQYVALDQSLIHEHINDWLSLARILYEPLHMKIWDGEKEAFSLTKLKQLLQELPPHEDLSIALWSDENQSSLFLINGSLLEKHLVTKGVFFENKFLLNSYLEAQMQKRGLFAYVRSFNEYIYHNTRRISDRLQFETPSKVEQLPKVKDKLGEIQIDCNQFAGYDIYYRGFCLTSCWQMYFSPRYRKLFPLEIIEDIQQVEEVSKLEHGILKIVLHKDPYKWDEPQNLAYQRLFRDQIGIDQLVWDNGIGVLREPFVEYVFTDYMIQTVQYQNERLQPTQKNKATHFVTRTYDLLHNDYKERRVAGVLNARAYFPWVDEEGMKMMNYIVVTPEYTLDEGLAAYEFYLRRYLEIDVEDPRYQHYLVVLNIYIPDRFVHEVPYQHLKNEMLDIKFSRLKKRKDRVFFNLKKKNNHLRVNFINISSLEKIKNQEMLGGR
ncbi:MAG: hypothetical protein ACK5MW_06650 [Enterococcus sp.]